MPEHREELFAEVARLLQDSLAADEENKRISEKYISMGRVVPGKPIRTPEILTGAGMREMQKAWDNREKAFQAYREALERYWAIT